MLIDFKSIIKQFGITIVACCAAFVCTLFFNFYIDLTALRGLITDEYAITMYNAQISVCKTVGAVTGCCLIATSVVLLIFYIKNYIDEKGETLGVLKAMGFTEFGIAKHFLVFGATVLVGCAIGFIAGWCYMPAFYKKQNEAGLFGGLTVNFHPVLMICIVILPAMAFSAIAVAYAFFKLKMPVMKLIRGGRKSKTKHGKPSEKARPFWLELALSTLGNGKTLVFLVAFSAFCFSAMVQMAVSMKQVSSETFASMMLIIGLVLAFTSLFLALSGVVKGNAKTIAMMKVIGYGNAACANGILGAYRPFAWLGFAVGTVYQHILLSVMVNVVFKDVGGVVEYGFDWAWFGITSVMFAAVYELAMALYMYIIKKLPVKAVMLEG